MIRKPSYVEIMSEFYPEITVSALGDGFDYDALTSDQPLPTKEDLDEKGLNIIRKGMWRLIQERRDSRKASGVKVGANWYHSDDPSRIQQIALVMLGANMPPNIMWKTMQGTFVQMTPQLATQIFQTIVASDKNVFERAEYHRQNMINSAEPLTYDYTVGWPMIYEESPEAAALRDYQ